jgi:hypothetical protein
MLNIIISTGRDQSSWDWNIDIPISQVLTSRVHNIIVCTGVAQPSPAL